jgi:hypothetical protein
LFYFAEFGRDKRGGLNAFNAFEGGAGLFGSFQVCRSLLKFIPWKRKKNAWSFSSFSFELKLIVEQKCAQNCLEKFVMLNGIKKVEGVEVQATCFRLHDSSYMVQAT